MQRATRIINLGTGLPTWQIGGVNVTDPAVIAELNAKWDRGCSYTAYVVRLDGDASVAATARAEGAGFVAGDIGNTFTLGGAGDFPEYVSYHTQWLGDTAYDAKLDWNDLEYHAGDGGGTAGYAQAELPTLSDASHSELHTQEIVLTANPGAFIEFRFKVRN